MEDRKAHPVLTGVKDIYGPTDVYGVTYEAIEKLKAVPLVLGQILESLDPDSAPVKGGADKRGNRINDPMLPVVYYCKHEWPNGKTSSVLTSTMGSSMCFVHEGLRRIVVNATYWQLGMENQINESLDCRLVGDYRPTMYQGINTSQKWSEKGLTPAKLR